jgi:hypothetical protein
VTDEQRALAAKFKAKIIELCKAQNVPIKHAFVSGQTVTLTFYGEAAAREIGLRLAPVIKIKGILPGYDQGKATAMRNGRREEVRVWRVHGTI